VQVTRSGCGVGREITRRVQREGTNTTRGKFRARKYYQSSEYAYNNDGSAIRAESEHSQVAKGDGTHRC
jgi:hypothetical protein